MKTSAQNTPATVITRTALASKLEALNGATFATASVETKVALKGGNPWKGLTVKKKQTLNGSLGFEYENSLTRQEEKHEVEHHHTPLPRTWGTLDENGVLVRNTKDGIEKLYAQFRVLSRPNKEDEQYFILETGETLSAEAVYEWKRPSTRPHTQDHLPEGVEIPIRDIALENIRKISLNGETFVITD